MKPIALSAAVLVFGCFATTQSYALDVRAIGMGGATVSAGNGMSGALSNPSSLMEAQRKKERYHFGLDFHGEVRDSADIVDLLDENENLIDDIDNEIDTLTGQTITCVPGFDSNDTACLNNTGTLGALAGDAVDVFNTVDEQPIDGQGGVDLGFAVSHTKIPFFINLGFRVTGAGVADVSETDKEYAQTLNDVLGDDVLTYQEILDSEPIEITPTNDSITIDIPDDVLNSEAEGSYLARTQFSVGIAKTFDLGGKNIDFGITPKISMLTASDQTKIISELDDDLDLTDEFKINEEAATTFTFDIGASMPLSNPNIEIAAVVKNVLPESIKTASGFEFETTPQVIISAKFAKDWYEFTGDLALNKGREDNFETHRLSIGTELGYGSFSFRAGILHDLAADEDPTEFSVGAGLGLVNIAVGVSGNSMKGGLNLSHSFK